MATSKLNPNARKWVRALRSGKYKQCRKTLEAVRGKKRSFCCLGVACDVFNNSVTKKERLSREVDAGEVNYDGNIGVLPDKVRQWLGLDDTVGAFEGGTLVMLNDSGKRFSTIANIIESKPPGLFTE